MRVKPSVLIYDAHGDPYVVEFWQRLFAGNCTFMQQDVLVWQRTAPDIIVIDKSVSVDLASDLDTAQRTYPFSVLVATGEGFDVRSAVQFMARDCSLVLEKPFESDDYAAANHPILDQLGKKRELRECAAVASRFNTLTDAECSVLDQMLDGKTNKEISDDLNVSLRTIEARRAKIYAKVDAANAIQVAKLYSKAKRVPSL